MRTAPGAAQPLRCTSSAGRCRRSFCRPAALPRSATGGAGSWTSRSRRSPASTAQVNGGPEPPRSELVEAGSLARDAVARWRAAVALAGPVDRARLAEPAQRRSCDRPGAVSRALDNLIANALEHGRGEIRVEGSDRAGRLRIVVADGADAGPGRRLRRPLCHAGSAVARGRPAVAMACGSSPTSPPTTAGASPPARTPPAPAPCSSCRSPSRSRPGAGEPPGAGRRLCLCGGLCAALAAAATGGAGSTTELGPLRAVVVATATLPAHGR